MSSFVGRVRDHIDRDPYVNGDQVAVIEHVGNGGTLAGRRRPDRLTGVTEWCTFGHRRERLMRKVC